MPAIAVQFLEGGRPLDFSASNQIGGLLGERHDESSSYSFKYSFSASLKERRCFSLVSVSELV